MFCVSHYSCANLVYTLLFYDRNEVDVPAELKRQLEASVHGVMMHHAATHTEYLEEHTRERRASIQEDETVKFIQGLNATLLAKVPNFTLRIKNGSYTITNYYNEEQTRKKKKKKDDDANKDGRAKQKIATVKTESPVYKLIQLLCRCLRGDLKPLKKEVIIMDQVNLAFQPGKMYLVL